MEFEMTPISYSEFLNYDANEKIFYIEWVRDTFLVTCTKMANDLFKIKRYKLAKATSILNIKFQSIHIPSKKIGYDYKIKWDNFINTEPDNSKTISYIKDNI